MPWLAAMEVADAVIVGLPLAAFSLTVSLLLRCWPRTPRIFLARERQSMEIVDVKELSHDTKRFRLSLGHKNTILGLPVGKHLVVYAPNPPSCLASGRWNGDSDPDNHRKEVERKYTPITGDECPGFVDLVVKIYRPGAVRMPDGKEVKWEDGGKASRYLDSKQPGDSIDVKGPVGVNEYLGRGMFKLPGRTVTVRRVGMIAGGTGLTPMLQVAQAALRDRADRVTFRLIYANKTEDDILCRDLLDDLEQTSNGRFQVFYTLDFPPAKWQHKTGFVTQQMIKECLPPPSESTLVLMCGPPPMVEFACKRNLAALGYANNSMVAF